MKLDNKVALVTGGTKGIGAAIATVLAGAGANVALIGRFADDEAKSVQKSILGLGRRCESLSKPSGACRRRMIVWAASMCWFILPVGPCRALS